MQNSEDTYKDLLSRAVGLYVNGTLIQYGLEDQKALEIVSNLTGLSPEALQKMKENRDNNIKENIDKSFDVITNIITR